ncbi:MAG: DUF4956 domain-containing protein [Acutalibacter sp.]
MTFQDIFKSSFLENVSSVSLLDMGRALVLAFGLGLFIFLIYKKTFAGVMYSSSFGVTLVGLTMITTLVILAVTSNVVLSLGMVGALSIVRFRAAIKEPLDIAFLFWAIAVGIVLAAGMIPLAVIGSVVIGLVLLGGPSWRWGWGWRRRSSTTERGNHPGHGTSPGWNACRSQVCARRSPQRDVKEKKDMARSERAMSFCWMRKPDEGSLAVVMQRQRFDGSSSGCWRPGREQLSLRGR